MFLNVDTKVIFDVITDQAVVALQMTDEPLFVHYYLPLMAKLYKL